MPLSLANMLALARKMFARERLPDPEPEKTPSRRRGLADVLFGSEELPLDPVGEAAGQRLLDVLFGNEDLPLDPTGEPTRHRLLDVVFGGEDLPPDPVRASGGRPGIASLFLGGEALPEDPPGPRRRRSRWGAWLFRPEHLDPS